MFPKKNQNTYFQIMINIISRNTVAIYVYNKINLYGSLDNNITVSDLENVEIIQLSVFNNEKTFLQDFHIIIKH